MEQEEIIKNGNDSIYLIKCLLNGQSPDITIVNQINMDQLLAFSKRHKITALLAKSLEQVIDSDVWKKEKNKAIRRTLLFDAERKKLFDYLNKNKIWYLPLKGIILANYYPEYGIREFADNDIYFNKEYQELVRDYFVQNGYEVIAYNKLNHDIYHKEPIFNFEMHTELFDIIVTENQNGYFVNYAKLLHNEHNSELSLSDNDFYVYYMAHSVKHYTSSGCGLRTLADIYLLNKLNLDREYISVELKKANIYETAVELNNLAVRSLSIDNKLNTGERDSLYKIYSLGTYGTIENRIDNQLKTISKGKLLMQRLFIPVEQLRNYYPTVYKNRILLPFFYVWRFRKIFGKRKQYFIRELKRIIRHNKIKKEDN